MVMFSAVLAIATNVSQVLMGGLTGGFLLCVGHSVVRAPEPPPEGDAGRRASSEVHRGRERRGEEWVLATERRAGPDGDIAQLGSPAVRQSPASTSRVLLAGV